MWTHAYVLVRKINISKEAMVYICKLSVKLKPNVYHTKNFDYWKMYELKLFHLRW